MKIVLPDWLRRLAETLSVLAALFCLICMIYWLAHPAITKSRKMNALYNWPLFSLCFFWLFCRLRESPCVQMRRVLLDAVVVLLAASRMLGNFIPSSGHALLLSYSLGTVKHRVYQIAAAAMLFLTVLFKLSWGDYRSWVLGILLGASGAFLYRQVGGEQ